MKSKKIFSILLIAIILTATLTMPSYARSRKHRKIKIINKKLVTVQGTIQKMSVNIYMQGSYKLTTDNGRWYILKSKTIDFSQYLGKTVEVKGTSQNSVVGRSSVKVITVTGITDLSVQSEESGQEQEEVITVTGKVRYIEYSIVMQGSSYWLFLENDRPYILKSTDDLSQYSGKTVIASGTVRPTIEGGGRILTVTSITTV